MRICYLVVAHTSPRHFSRLLQALTADPRDAVMVHVDASTDIKPFAAEAPLGGRVAFTSQRVSVRWATFSQVRATLQLLEDAVNRFPESDYFCLLSGDSYPLASTRDIRGVLAKRPDREYINLVQMPGVNKELTRLTRYYFGFDARSSVLGLALSKVSKLMRRNPQSALNGMTPFCGSNWWTLTSSAARFLLAQSEAQPHWLKFCRNSLFADEHYFHTLLGNSDFRTRVVPALMHTEWPAVGPAPAYLTSTMIADLAKVCGVKTDAYGTRRLLFGRKFPDESEALTAEVRRRLWPAPASDRTGLRDDGSTDVA